MSLRSTLSFWFGVAVGAGVTLLLEPARGQQRREQLAATLRDTAQEAEDRLEYQANRAKGVAAEVARAPLPEEQPEPQTLIHKVESEVLGPADVPSGEISVDAADGVVTLRGEVASQEQIDEIVRATEVVEGVSQVRNLLHLPSEAPPNVEEEFVESQSG